MDREVAAKEVLLAAVGSLLFGALFLASLWLYTGPLAGVPAYVRAETPVYVELAAVLFGLGFPAYAAHRTAYYLEVFDHD